jgi:hypothetical protein
MPTGVVLSFDKVLPDGSAALIAAAFMSAPNAELVTHAMTRPMQMRFAGFGFMPAKILTRFQTGPSPQTGGPRASAVWECNPAMSALGAEVVSKQTAPR